MPSNCVLRFVWVAACSAFIEGDRCRPNRTWRCIHDVVGTGEVAPGRTAARRRRARIAYQATQPAPATSATPPVISRGSAPIGAMRSPPSDNEDLPAIGGEDAEGHPGLRGHREPGEGERRPGHQWEPPVCRRGHLGHIDSGQHPSPSTAARSAVRPPDRVRPDGPSPRRHGLIRDDDQPVRNQATCTLHTRDVAHSTSTKCAPALVAVARNRPHSGTQRQTAPAWKGEPHAIGPRRPPPLRHL